MKTVWTLALACLLKVSVHAEEPSAWLNQKHMGHDLRTRGLCSLQILALEDQRTELLVSIANASGQVVFVESLMLERKSGQAPYSSSTLVLEKALPARKLLYFRSAQLLLPTPPEHRGIQFLVQSQIWASDLPNQYFVEDLYRCQFP